MKKSGPKVRKLILTNWQSPGDIVVLTAAVRDLHKTHPGRFITDVRTSCHQLWENNPYISPLNESDPTVLTINCEYPLIHKSNNLPRHFIESFVDFFNQKLGLHITPTAFKGDIHITQEEKSWFSQIREILGRDIPFWIVVAGGKFDFTIKWWESKRFQQVVDFFKGKILFVQIGEKDHAHPPLKSVIDLRGKTDLRQVVRLFYHSQGVLCPVTMAMHLAAAVEVKGNIPQNRPCVVVAGGREPSQWEAYPHHQFIHTNGALFCCDSGGCWKSRTVPIGDGDEKDNPDKLCVDVVNSLPRCMDMITSDDVCRRISLYFQGGTCSYLSPEDAAHITPFLTSGA
jgi:ADP-heptose:LPS heptosyltransferase